MRKLSNLQKLVEYFGELKGWPKDFVSDTFTRHARPARDILKFSNQDLETAKLQVLRCKKWATANNLDWMLDTVIRRWPDLEKLAESKRVPYIDNDKAYQKNGTWYVITHEGNHVEYVGSLDKLEYRDK